MIKVEIGGLDSNGGCLYVGSGCFHRRDALCGRSYSENTRFDWEEESQINMIQQGIDVLEKECKILASCSYEHDTQWGKQVLSLNISPIFFYFFIFSK